MTKLNEKPLSQMLEESEAGKIKLEPKFIGSRFAGYNQLGGTHYFDSAGKTYDFVDRASYDRMKRVAIELAKACEETKIHCGATTIRSWRETRLKFTNINQQAIDRAKDIIGGGDNV